MDNFVFAQYLWGAGRNYQNIIRLTYNILIGSGMTWPNLILVFFHLLGQQLLAFIRLANKATSPFTRSILICTHHLFLNPKLLCCGFSYLEGTFQF